MINFCCSWKSRQYKLRNFDKYSSRVSFTVPLSSTCSESISINRMSSGWFPSLDHDTSSNSPFSIINKDCLRLQDLARMAVGCSVHCSWSCHCRCHWSRYKQEGQEVSGQARLVWHTSRERNINLMADTPHRTEYEYGFSDPVCPLDLTWPRHSENNNNLFRVDLSIASEIDW